MILLFRMDVSSLKRGVAAGTITVERVLELLLQQMEVYRQPVEINRRLRDVNWRLTARVAMLEARLARYEPPPKDVDGSGAPTNYSVAADEQRRRGRRKKQKSARRGRLPTEDKLAEATRFEDVFPARAKPVECVLARTRVAWRIVDGQAVRVAYRVHRREHRSDAPAVCRGRFTQAQKCWAHLLRKAVQFTLLYPEKRHYQRFLDDLLAVYREAKSARQDGRLSDAGRQRAVERLETRLWDVAAPHQKIWESPSTPDERDFANLVRELFRLVATNKLFTFVRHPAVEPTNNVSERELRGPALCRKTGRTNKTPQGAHRQSVITSVLRSLQKHLPTFTLRDVVSEVLSWPRRGLNLFREQLVNARASLKLADTS
jgi:hypothetical protein